MDLVKLCIKNIQNNPSRDPHLDYPLGRLHFAAGFLKDVPEIAELLNAIVEEDDSPVTDQSRKEMSKD